MTGAATQDSWTALGRNPIQLDGSRATDESPPLQDTWILQEPLLYPSPPVGFIPENDGTSLKAFYNFDDLLIFLIIEANGYLKGWTLASMYCANQKANTEENVCGSRRGVRNSLEQQRPRLSKHEENPP
ncbi:hypothetical protein A6R68_13613, partial [Neotoma lepida]